MLDVWQLAG